MSDLKLYKILESFDELESAADKLSEVTEDDVNEEAVDESQTKVQTMGNKVRVTTDGDTTEFDDAETAATMMGTDDDDENGFATESEEVDEDAEEVTEEVVDEAEEEAEEVTEAGLEPTDADLMAIDAEPVDAADAFGDWFNDDNPDDLLYDPATDTEFAREGAGCMEDENEPEFATFDSENESHRKRLQRGTPVVLDKDLFSNPDVNRRGVFISRSPSGDFARVIRDVDGKEVKVHLSDIKSADLVNNSIYEEFGVNLEAMLAEDITMTQTSNLENPENDTTTVTAVGPEAGEELAAMMANAGLNTGEYAGIDAPPIDAGEVDTGEAEPVELGMSDMIGLVGDEVAQEAFGDDDMGDDFGMGDMDDMEPTDADLAAIDADPEWDLDFEESVVKEDDIQYLSPEVAKAIVDGADIYDLMHDESVPPKDREALVRDIDELMLGGDNELTAYENLAGKIYDMYGGMDEARDIEHANTPDERVSDVDMVTHGTSGGLNKPKRMYKPAGNRHGDNAMQRPMEDMYNEEMELEEELSPEMQARKERDLEAARVRRDMSTRSKGSRLRGRGRGTGQHDRSVNLKFGEAEEVAEEENKLVNEHENVDSFLDLYKEFTIRTDKK